MEQNKYKTKITIEVAGPGMVINNEMALLEEFLKSKGATVIVDIPYPDDREGFWRDCEGMEITLKAKHYVWGG